MSLITDPSYLSQGNTTAFPVTAISINVSDISGANGRFVNATATTMPSLNTYEYFEIRDFTGTNGANNNGLYQVEEVVSSGQNYIVRKLAGSQGDLTAATSQTGVFLGSNTILGNTNPGTALTETATGKSVYFDTYNKEIWLFNQGNVTDDGFTFQSLYSFTKDQWKDDPFLIKFDFPFTAITPEQFEIGATPADGWRFAGDIIRTDAVYDNTVGRKSRELLRTSGWREYDADGTTVLQEYAGIITLGTFDADTDQAYYQQGNDPTDTGSGATGGPQDFIFSGPVNEGVLTFDYNSTSNNSYGATVITGNTITRATGSWITDGYVIGGGVRIMTSDTAGNIGTSAYIDQISATVLNLRSWPDGSADATLTPDADDQNFTAAIDNRNSLKLFLRANSSVSISKTYSQSDTDAIGVTAGTGLITNQAYRFPLTNGADSSLPTSVSDGTDDVTADNPYTSIDVRYLSETFQAQVDSLGAGGTLQNFGIIIENGTYSGSNGSITGAVLSLNDNATNPLVTNEFASGTLVVHNTTSNTNGGSAYTIVSNDTTSITISTSPGDVTDASFTAYRSTANQTSLSLPASLGQVYSKLQYDLRQASDIDVNNNADNVVVGKTADILSYFVGNIFYLGDTIASTPRNPLGGGSGVYLAGFSTSDQNNIRLFNNSGGTAIQYPTVVTLTINFNANLTDDQIAGGSQDFAKFWTFFEYTNRETSASTFISSVTGRIATITTTGSLFAQNNGTTNNFQVDDYIRLSGFTGTDTNNNGIYRITAHTDANNINAVKVDGAAPTTTTAGDTINVDETPIDTPDAIILEAATGASSPLFANNVPISGEFQQGYAYTDNSQGKNAGSTALPIIVRAIGLEKGQFIETDPATLGATDLTIAVTAGLERNYSNP